MRTGAVITMTANHWATNCNWVDDVLVPFLLKKKAAIGLPEDEPALLLLDVWKVGLRHPSQREPLIVRACSSTNRRHPLSTMQRPPRACRCN